MPDETLQRLIDEDGEVDADHGPLSAASGAREVAALEAPRPRQAGERADGEHRRGGAGLERLRGHERDVVERGEVEHPARRLDQRRRRLPQEGTPDERVGDRVARPRDEREASAAEAQEQQR